MLELFIWFSPASVAEAQEVLEDLCEMSEAVQFPDKTRGLYKSKQEVNTYFKRLYAICLRRSKAKKDDWYNMAIEVRRENKKLNKVKEAAYDLDQIY